MKTCQECLVPLRTLNRTGYCVPCQKAHRCPVCGGQKARGQSRCFGCERALLHTENNHHDETKGPPREHNEERLNELAERASKGLPLFD